MSDMKISTAQQRNRRAKNYALPKDPNDPRHGTASFYQNHGCRCERCTDASRRQREGYERKTVTRADSRTSFSVIEYTNDQGSRIIAVMDNEAMWNVLCLTEAGTVKHFRWTFDKLTYDAGTSNVKTGKR